jgi:hypothetical protein
MNTLEQTLVEIISSAVQDGKELKDFALEQIPDVLQQTLLWYGAYNFTLFVLAIVFTVASIYLYVKFFRWASKKDWSDFIPLTPVIVLTPLVPVFTLFNLEWLKIWLAPKLWLIEFAAELAKGVGK